MQIRFASMLAGAASILFCVYFVGCHCCKECPENAGPACEVTPSVGAVGYFGEDDGVHPKQSAQLRVTGSFTYEGAPGDLVRLEAVKIYGMRGLKNPVDLRIEANRLETLSPVTDPWRTECVDRSWMGERVYSMLVHYDVKIVQGSASHTCSVEHWGYFDGITKSPFITLKDIAVNKPTGGQTNASVASNGSFNGAQNLALYDVLVSNPTAKVVDSIQISAGPSAGGLTTLYTEPAAHIPLPPFDWRPRPNPVAGSYDGTDDYVMEIKVHYTDTTVNPNPEIFTGHFRAIVHNQGSPILLN